VISHILDIPIPIAEKIVRAVVVYVFLILILRLFGKRELAQLNPFDLIVLLMLSNTVQNAIIGEDNSITGGIIGAAARPARELCRSARHVPLSPLRQTSRRLAHCLDR
jgi:hypothetical protein